MRAIHFVDGVQVHIAVMGWLCVQSNAMMEIQSTETDAILPANLKQAQTLRAITTQSANRQTVKILATVRVIALWVEARRLVPVGTARAMLEKRRETVHRTAPT